MASYRPLIVYRHDGQTLHPKLTYALPPGMGNAMVKLGFFEKVEQLAEVDLSGMDWNSKTVAAFELVPASMESLQEN